MNQINLFIELTRLKKPIGFMLLFWPCSWGLTLAYDFEENLNYYFMTYHLFELIFAAFINDENKGCGAKGLDLNSG